MRYPPIQGAYTELFAGLSPEITTAQNGAYSMLHVFPLAFTFVTLL